MSASGNTAKPYLFVVEDCDDDLFLLSRALRKTGVTHLIECAANGVQGIKYFKALLAEVPNASELPSLVILDIKMPMVDGHEMLAWMRAQPPLLNLPVCILSSSELHTDVAAAFQTGASDYWRKPSSMAGYHQLAAKIKGLLLPPEEAA